MSKDKFRKEMENKILAEREKVAVLEAKLAQVKAEVYMRKAAGSASARWVNFDRILSGTPEAEFVIDDQFCCSKCSELTPYNRCYLCVSPGDDPSPTMPITLIGLRRDGGELE